MRSFEYVRPTTASNIPKKTGEEYATEAASQFLAGGTTLLDLMKLDAMRPDRVIDLNGLDARYTVIEVSEAGVRLGALVRMSQAEGHQALIRDYPVLTESLRLAASPQIRNMASLAGNVLQRTRCNYFRDTSYASCNKRIPGSGCSAIEGVNRKLAVLGTSPRCIAHYPGDFAQALIALDATVEIASGTQTRRIPFEKLHRQPGDTPHLETELKAGELITSFFIPSGPWTRRSVYLKIRDRESYEFALASAAVAIDLREGRASEIRIALGGVATTPWRAREAEEVLQDKIIDEASATKAAAAAFANAVTHGGNDYKPELGRRTLVRAILHAASMELE